MSKQVGLIKLKGNMGGVSFFQSEGKHLAKMANGPDRERILNDPNFQRTRENNREFGGSAKAAKAFRLSLSPIMYMSDARFVGRLTKIFKEINKEGDGIRGERPIMITEHGAQFNDLEFNIHRPLSTLFTEKPVIAHAADRKSATITFPDIVLRDSVKAPEGSTHAVLIQGLGVVSDFNYSTSLKRYEPVDAALNTVGKVTYTDYLPLEVLAPSTITISTQIPVDGALSENVSVIQCFGIEFYQFVKGNYYPLFQANAMKVVQAF